VTTEGAKPPGLADLFSKVDAFFERAARAFPAPDGITCHAGCDACCIRKLSVTELEAEAIAAHVAAMPERERDALGRAARVERPEACAALVDGRCAIYAARPVVCRSHGVPIRFPPSRGRSLPVVDACPLNFRGHDLAALPASFVLDQTTLSTLLGALDAARADATGAARGRRVDLAELLRRTTEP
jgi:hypothetical protein